MNPLTIEWIEKAEGDFVTAQRELRARLSPNFDAACFHSQQVAEKYLKAFLQEHGEAVPRIHSLIDLLALCLKNNPSFQIIRLDLTILESYSVRIRYPGFSANKSEAKNALKSASNIRTFIRNALGMK